MQLLDTYYDRLLQRCGLVHSAKSMEQDSLRQTASKLELETAQNRAELDTQRETLAKLAHQVSSLEFQLNQVVGYPDQPLSLSLLPPFSLR